MTHSGCIPGAGANPISTFTQYAIATDECPECLTGALDLGQDGDGRWGISWYPVQCDVGSTTFQYSFAGSNAQYVKMAITNTRYSCMLLDLHSGLQSHVHLLAQNAAMCVTLGALVNRLCKSSMSSCRHDPGLCRHHQCTLLDVPIMTLNIGLQGRQRLSFTHLAYAGKRTQLVLLSVLVRIHCFTYAVSTMLNFSCDTQHKQACSQAQPSGFDVKPLQSENRLSW